MFSFLTSNSGGFPLHQIFCLLGHNKMKFNFTTLMGENLEDLLACHLFLKYIKSICLMGPQLTDDTNHPITECNNAVPLL